MAIDCAGVNASGSGTSHVAGHAGPLGEPPEVGLADTPPVEDDGVPGGDALVGRVGHRAHEVDPGDHRPAPYDG